MTFIILGQFVIFRLELTLIRNMCDAKEVGN